MTDRESLKTLYEDMYAAMIRKDVAQRQVITMGRFSPDSKKTESGSFLG